MLLSRAALVVFAALAGCDAVFGLEIEPDAGADAGAGIDAAMTDTTAPLPAEPCPTTYTITIGRKQYKWIPTSQYWPDAEADCRLDSLTSITHLPVFETLAELEALKEEGDKIVSGWRIPVGYARDRNVDPPSYRSVTGVALPKGSALWDDASLPYGGVNTTVELAYDSALFDARVYFTQRPYFCQCDGIRATEVFNL